MKTNMFLLSVIFSLLSLAFAAPFLGNQRLTTTTRDPTLLISLDGFNAEKLNQFLTENPLSVFQKEFVDVGTKAEYMMPSFPSLTFPFD